MSQARATANGTRALTVSARSRNSSPESQWQQSNGQRTFALALQQLPCYRYAYPAGKQIWSEADRPPVEAGLTPHAVAMP